MYDVIIVGGGPAAVAAGVYAARKKLKTLVITDSFGGQSVVSDGIENWIGAKSISGFDLAKNLEEHLRAQPSVEIRTPERVTAVREIACADGHRPCDWVVETDKGNSFETKTVIVTSGARRRRLGIPGEDKFEGKGVAFCATCLPPEEGVVANSSVVNIADVPRFHSVLTADGSFQRVNEIMARSYNGELVEIKTRFFSESVRLTPNHPVLATTIHRGNAEYYWRDFKIEEPSWIRTGDLEEKHVLLYPVISGTKDVKTIHISDILGVGVVDGLAKNSNERHTSRRVPNVIPVDGDFLRLVGYYLAEGTPTATGLNFYFSVKERAYIKDVKSIFRRLFQLTPALKVEGSVARVQVYSKLASRFFQHLFGKYSYGKQLPHWILMLPKEKQGELIRGIYRGDGCKRDKDFCIVTNSRILTYQLRDILLRLGVLPLIQRRSVASLNRKPNHIGDRLIRFRHDKYHVIAGGASLQRMTEILGIPHKKIKSRSRICHHGWLDKHYAYLPVRRITQKPYRGKVYNLVVDKNNTYVAKNFIVHNCDAPIFAGKRVAVVGGGNAGLEAVVDLFPYASEIYLVHRGEQLKGDAVTQEAIKKNPKVRIILNAETQEIVGDKFMTALRYKDKASGEIKDLAAEGVFVEVGSLPNTDFVKGVVDLNEFGEIIIDHKTSAASKPGIYAAGDATDEIYKQNNISAGDGVKAALSAYSYIMGLKKRSAAAEKPSNNG